MRILQQPVYLNTSNFEYYVIGTDFGLVQAMKWLMKIALAGVLFVGLLNQTIAQQPLADVYRATVHNGDTIANITLSTHRIVERRTWKDRRQHKKYVKLARKVKKVYPYAALAGHKLNEYAAELADVESEREKKQFYRRVEEELKAEYAGELKKLTISEGKILIKLIDRQTGDTSYELVETLRGKFSAFFWQGLSRLFGQNLKSEYDPTGEDREIEFIVQQIEAGII